MKKSLAITLNGQMFNLEEDGYEKLKKYLDSIEGHYDNQAEAKEIVSDIESSIADKFSEKARSEREAITAEDVDGVTKIMGSAEEITQDTPVSSAGRPDSNMPPRPVSRKLYRDTEDVVIAGIASGIAAFFGIDPLFVRIMFIITFFAHGFSLIVYLVLWIALPKAETNAQKLEMRGRPVSWAEIEQAVKEKSKIVAEEGGEAVKRLREDNVIVKLLNFPIVMLKAFFNFLTGIWRVLWPLMSAIAGIFFVLGSTIGIIVASVMSTLLVFNINSPYLSSDLPLEQLASMPLFYIAVISFYISAVLPLIILTAIGIMLIRRKNSFRPVSTGIMIGIWMLSVIIFAVAALSLLPTIRSSSGNYDIRLKNYYEYNSGQELELDNGSGY